LNHDELADNHATYLIIYGTIDTTRHANEAHAKYKPGPVETTIPTGTRPPGGPARMFWTDWDFCMITVQMAEPERTRMLDRTAEPVDKKNAQVCLITPL
jgi:hypothetical protein